MYLLDKKERLVSCSFTGHRPQNLPCGMDESHPVCEKIKTALADQILRLYQHRGTTNFYTGGAIGVDQWAAEAVLALRQRYPEIMLTIVIPFHNQAERYTPAQCTRLIKKQTTHNTNKDSGRAIPYGTSTVKSRKN